MIGEVLTHARQVPHHDDGERAQVIGGADPRAQEEGGAAIASGGENDRLALEVSPRAGQGDADRPPALEEDAVDERLGPDGQVAAAPGRAPDA